MTRLRTLSASRPTIVIGSGIVGASTAAALAVRGVQVLLLERFSIGHDQGSSHGESRIIRYSYSDPFYANLMSEAFRAWAKLEADTGVPLYLRTGCLSFCPTDSSYVLNVIKNLKNLEIPCRQLTGTESRKLYPGLEIPDGFQASFEPAAGVLMAARVPRLLTDLASRQAGALFELRENYDVQGLDLDQEFPVVFGPNDERIEAERVVVAAGPWVHKLLPNETKSLEVTRQSVFHIKTRHLDPFRPGNWPILIYKSDDDKNLFYSLPALSDLGIKVARHGGPVCEPDQVDRVVSEHDWQPVLDFVSEFVPEWADAEIVQKKTCLYTMTPDEDFRVGPIASHPRVIMASPCSGHGFKFGPLIGRIVADLCETGMCDYDISRWNPLKDSKNHKAPI